MKPMWTWSGEFFGYKDGDELWTKHGKHVGKFYGKDIYAEDGKYLGELLAERLITDKSKRNLKKQGFKSRSNCSFMVSYINYTGASIRGGYEHFPQIRKFK